MWHTPAAATRTSTSPARGRVELELAVTSSGLPYSCRTAARVLMRSDAPPAPRGPGSRRARGRAAARPSRRRAISIAAPPSSQSRRSGLQPGGSCGTSMKGQVETASARCRLASSPRPFDQVCGENIRPHRSAMPGDPAAAAEAAGQHGVRLHDVDAAAQQQVARLVQAAHHLARRQPQRRAGPAAARSPRRRASAAAPPASRRRGARARGRTGSRWRRPSGALRSPAVRQPWLASTISSMSEPTASRTASTTATSSRQSGAMEAELHRAHAGVAQRGHAPRALRRLDELAAGGVGRDPLGAAAEQPPERLAERPGRRGPRPRPRRSRAGRRGSRRSRTARARPRCGAGRARPAGARAAPRRAARRRSRSPPCRRRRARSRAPPRCACAARDPTRPRNGGSSGDAVAPDLDRGDAQRQPPV